MKQPKKQVKVAEPNNRFDEHAVAIYAKDCKLGYIPKGMNKTIAVLLNSGYTNIFKAYIQHIDTSCLYNGVRVVIYAKTLSDAE